MSSRRAGGLAGAVRRVLLRADRGPLRRIFLAGAELLMRALAGYLRRGVRAAVYVRGGFGFGEPVLGVSDLDLVAVVAGESRAPESSWLRLVSRWQRLERMLPGLGRVAYLECYCQTELEESRWTRFTYGLDGRRPGSLLFGDSPHSWSEERPGSLPLLLPDLWPLDCWRRISGPDLRPRTGVGSSARSHLLVWVHLQYWWRLGLRVLAEPAAPWVAYACVKLVAEPAKILLWLEHGERQVARRQILRRALEALPEEEPAITFALALLDGLGDTEAAPLEVVWPCFARLSARIARRLSADLGPSGSSAVRLEGVGPSAAGGSEPRTLCDWTALIWPPGREESFVVTPGSAAELSAVRAALEDSTATRFATVLSDGLMVRPGRRGREWFRSVDFAATDPVSAALLAGQTVAAFPEVAGWSASHTAARAVAEHAAWLQLPRHRAADSEPVPTDHLAGLFSAARAGLFLQSIQAGDPVLTVAFEATATALAERVPEYRCAVEEAYDGYRTAAGGGPQPRREVLRAAAGALEGLGSYPTPFRHLRPPQRETLTGTGGGVAAGA